MTQVRYTRREIMNDPETAKKVKEHMLEFNAYIRKLELPDIFAVTDFINSYLEDMIKNKDDGLAELKYAAVTNEFTHVLVYHVLSVRRIKESFEKSMGKDLESLLDDMINEPEPKPSTPFKNRRYLN